MPMRSGSGTAGPGRRLRWRAASAAGLLLVAASAAVSQAPVSHASTRAAGGVSRAAATTWTLAWSDEFNSASALQPWTFVTGGTGFGVKQLQWYSKSNAALDGSGHLVITAAKGGGGHTCWYGTCRYRSARINTLSTFHQTYGRFEARIKFAPGRGLWPAFWLEGTNVGKVGWPKAGEIDVVEPNSINSSQVRAYAHSPGHGYFASYNLPKPLSAGYHVYGVDWSSTQIRWWVDGHTYGVWKAYQGWPFNHPFFIILNLAVGGGYSGPPDAATPFPARMLVDWVRVYK